MPDTEEMIDCKKFNDDCNHEIFFRIDYNHCEIKEFQFQIRNFKLLQYSNVIENLFFCHKT